MNAIPIRDRCIRMIVATLCFPLTIVQTVIAKLYAKKYRQPGELVAIGTDHLHAIITGNGKSTVVLESGMGGVSLDWSLVQHEISGHATVLSYDRAGFGFSNRLLKMPTCQQYVEDLRCLLHTKQLKPPYILVGHSYGGMIIRLFASQYRDEVAGLVLVDAAHESRFIPKEMGAIGKEKRRISRKLLRLGYLLSPIAIPRFMKRHIGSRNLPSSIQKVIKQRGYRNEAYRTAYAEMLCTEMSAEQLVAAPPLPNHMPVIVMSAGKQDEEWKKGQEKLLDITGKVTHINVEDSWHSIQVHRPDTVIAAIKSSLFIGNNCNDKVGNVQKNSII
ncbi:alpha/beta hydrolase [Paenibacillus sp. GSMTC-2017]|uniref:alpha/beta hydrolase n=1 Tax=Paenibacillus sp. GSMTC-2017 TaxID=2794350 RepID=UPI0018D88F65|nr:alpha/beta hydrolase [Paenibacillus sp. GSMTC-2017]MBH5318880.1 alpha/beta hydrolase [Paenibacillus sp. GSMTC-2017]